MAFGFLPLTEVFLSDQGVFPRETMFEVARRYRFSLLDHVGSPELVQLFFIVWIAVLVLLGVGWKTRLMTIINFILVLSIHERNLFILNGGDTLLRLLGFWMIFLPAGAYYSLDAFQQRAKQYRRTGQLADIRVESSPRMMWAFPLRIIQLQVACVYVFSAMTKLIGYRWMNGEAIYLAFQLEPYRRPLALWIVENIPEQMMFGITLGVVLLETTWILLVFSPILQPLLRRLALLAGVALHTGIATAMVIQNFSQMLLSSYLLFLEARIFKRLDGRLRIQRQLTLVPSFPDGHPLLLFLAQTSEARIQVDHSRAQPEWSSSGFDAWTASSPDGDVFMGPDAWRATLGHLPLSRLWLWVVRFSAIREILWYSASRWASRQHPRILSASGQQRSSLRLPRGAQFAAKGIVTVVLAYLFIITVQWNAGAVYIDDFRLAERPDDFQRSVIYYTGLFQGWRTFSPTPKRTFGPLVFEGTFEDDSVLDLRTGLPVGERWAIWKNGPRVRWRKYEETLQSVQGDNDEERLRSWVAYYCQAYSEGEQTLPSNRLEKVEVWYYYRISLARGDVDPGQSERLVWQDWCLVSVNS